MAQSLCASHPLRHGQTSREAALQLRAPLPSADELLQGLQRTWGFMAAYLERWSPGEMRQIFPDEPVDASRTWVVWHVLEHDLHHGGELSLILGLHRLLADFPG